MGPFSFCYSKNKKKKKKISKNKKKKKKKKNKKTSPKRLKILHKKWYDRKNNTMYISVYISCTSSFLTSFWNLRPRYWGGYLGALRSLLFCVTLCPLINYVQKQWKSLALKGIYAIIRKNFLTYYAIPWFLAKKEILQYEQN